MKDKIINVLQIIGIGLLVLLILFMLVMKIYVSVKFAETPITDVPVWAWIWMEK